MITVIFSWKSSSSTLAWSISSQSSSSSDSSLLSSSLSTTTLSTPTFFAAKTFEFRSRLDFRLSQLTIGDSPGDEAVNSMKDSSEQELNERWRNRKLKIIKLTISNFYCFSCVLKYNESRSMWSLWDRTKLKADNINWMITIRGYYCLLIYLNGTYQTWSQ